MMYIKLEVEHEYKGTMAMLPGLGLYLNIPIRVRLHWELNAGPVLYSVKDKNLDQVVFD